MNLATESDSRGSLYCELCDFVHFSSYADFHIHHLSHIRQPLVRLVKINPNLSAKLQCRSYKVNTGVARRSNQFEHVPPLKISVVNQQGLKQFHVVKNENNAYENNFLNQNHLPDKEHSVDELHKESSIDDNKPTLEVEGKNLLERFGASISISRKGKPLSQTKTALENSEGSNGKRGSEGTDSFGLDAREEPLAERLSGLGGISISAKSKSSTNGNPEVSSGTVPSVSISKLKSMNSNQFTKLKECENEKSKILRKLNEAGVISVAKSEADKSDGKTPEGSERSEEREGVERLACKISIRSFKSKSEDSNDSVESRKSDDQVKSGEDESGKSSSENSREGSEQRRFVRVKNSKYSKKNIRLEKQSSLNESHIEDATGSTEDPKDTDTGPRETGIDILERLTDNLNNTVGGIKSALIEKSEDSNQKTMEEPLLTSNINSAEQQPDSPLPANQSECSNNNSDGESHFGADLNSQDEEQACPLLLTPPSSSGQHGENSNYSNTSSSHQSEPFTEANNVSEGNDEVNDNSVPFSSLSNEDQSQEQTDQPNSFWSDLRGSASGVDQPQQDPLLAPDNSVSNGGDTLNSNFLHNFLSEHSQSNSIPPENSEFMSLDRLAQTQHQQPSFDLSTGEANTPMEQLSQQVQRIPNPTPQINVISQHHMQAPQPPQLHTGVPLSPQHISPQQPNSYDALSHMQPPMPPPLYQGFNMFNQNFSPQTPQQMPRPPMLQQRPQIQARPFQSLAASPRQRARGPKRNVVRLSPSHEIAPPKQPRRLDPPLQARSQIQNPAAKLPSGITVTPPKNATEANKVANVLASRGITVTPAVSRQTNQAPRSQPRSTGQSPILNIGSGISITSSSQNRNSGGFAVPGPRRNTPIVNHHVERPERCTTVDLTLDDEPPQMSRNRAGTGRYPCKQCGKIFTSLNALESHKPSHRAAATLPYKCDKCTAQYTMAVHLQQHKLNFHKTKQSAPDLAIPIVDLNHPGAREQLIKCGVYNFIPLAQLQSNNNGYFGVPIIQLDTAKEKAVSNLSALGAANIFVLGKMKALVPHPNQ